MTIEQQRDFSTNYHEITIGDLARLARFPEFNWTAFLNSFFGAGVLDLTERIAIYAKDYYTQLPDIISKTDYDVLHNYVVWISTGLQSLVLCVNFKIVQFLRMKLRNL